MLENLWQIGHGIPGIDTLFVEPIRFAWRGSPCNLQLQSGLLGFREFRQRG